ncbi:hypothetical protein CEXT_611701 [Caerostris extrusa]|uniref:Uncharacterized protein n=1 Tax=Caerostris extrusa TaxID=172846 RepID=A0AAV4TPK5_CAEEX|nr:hypothetical protein CEXT_611701 [Caerostris extrusa]
MTTFEGRIPTSLAPDNLANGTINVITDAYNPQNQADSNANEDEEIENSGKGSSQASYLTNPKSKQMQTDYFLPMAAAKGLSLILL